MTRLWCGHVRRLRRCGVCMRAEVERQLAAALARKAAPALPFVPAPPPPVCALCDGEHMARFCPMTAIGRERRERAGYGASVVRVDAEAAE